MPGLEGRTLAGRYRVDEYIGGGGMGDVYKVWDTDRSCYLATKVMRQHLAEFEELAHRFEREAEALSRLQHPNIVRLYGLERDEHEDLAFIVMDYVDGPTLADKLKMARGPLPLTEVVSMTEDVAAALTYAHNQTIYHRDIKPSNIIIARDGRAILADFGIARLSDALTMTYQGIGTPAYMSPEQCEGKEAGAPSDIYSLGVVLYESLVGRRPFLGDLGRGEPPTTANIIREHVELPPPPPTDVNPSLRPQVEAVVMRTLAKDPEYRYQTAAELSRELRVAAGGAALPSLRITSTPGGAQVYVDGDLRGASPLDITRLPEGDHRIRIVAHGYQDHEQTIELPEFRSLDVSLEPLGTAAETIVVAPEVATGTREGGIPPRTPPAASAGGGPRWWRRWWFRVALGLAGGGIVIGVLALLFILSQGGDGEEGVVVGSPTPTSTAAPDESADPDEPPVTPVPPSGQITYLTELTLVEEKGFGAVGKAARDDIPSVEAELFTSALVMQTGYGGNQTFITYDLAGQFSRFEADVGLHDSVADTDDIRVEFRVLGDGEELFVTDRPLGPGDPALPVSVDVTGVRELTLFTLQRSGGCCLAEIVWGDPRVIQDQSESSAPASVPTGYPVEPTTATLIIDGPVGSRKLVGGGPSVKTYSEQHQVGSDPDRANAAGWNCRTHQEYIGQPAVDWYLPKGTAVLATLDGTATLYVNTAVNTFDYYGVPAEPYLGNPDRSRASLNPFPGPNGGKGVWVEVVGDNYVTRFVHLEAAATSEVVPAAAFLDGYSADVDFESEFSEPRTFTEATPIARWDVEHGDVVGLTGDSGYAEGPQLHYDVARAGESTRLCPTDEPAFSDSGWLS